MWVYVLATYFGIQIPKDDFNVTLRRSIINPHKFVVEYILIFNLFFFSGCVDIDESIVEEFSPCRVQIRSSTGLKSITAFLDLPKTIKHVPKSLGPSFLPLYA